MQFKAELNDARIQSSGDPAELRRRNTIPPEAMPYKTALTFTYDCGEFEKTMNMALDKFVREGKITEEMALDYAGIRSELRQMMRKTEGPAVTAAS